MDRTQNIITAATGFCELQMWQDACDELKKLALEDRARVEVLGLRLRILIALERWESAAAVAEGMIASGRASAATWIQGAHATRHHLSVAEARDSLLRGERQLEECATFHFNLACYECQLGNMNAAAKRLTRAVELDPRLKQAALDEPDLWPIW